MSDVENADHSLMLAVREGDTDQLGPLFERHHRPLYGFFVRLTNQRSQSEDLVQQVFYRILKYRHTYRNDGKFTSWMYHLARRVAADHFRKNGHLPAHSEGFEVETLPDDAPDSGERLQQRDDLSLMQEAFSQLALEEREILTLQRFQHLAHEEIAQLLECSVGAAKVRAHRALKALREKFLRLRRREDNSTPRFSS